MRIRLFLSAVLSAVVFLFFACSEGEIVRPGPESSPAPMETAPAVERSHWEKIGIPNSVSNIRRLVAERRAEAAGADGGPSLFGASAPEPEVEATHYYVRFEPDNDQEYYALKADGNLDLYSHPLDCVIPEGEVSYIDPEQPLEKPPFLFGIMPAGYSPGSARYTVLDEIVREPSAAGPDDLVDRLWINDGHIDDGDYRGGALFANPDPNDFFDQIGSTGSMIGGGKSIKVPGASPIIGDVDYTNGLIQPGSSDSRYKGRIRAWDDEIGGYVPLVGVKVKVFDFWEGSAIAITDSKGVFVIDKRYRRDVAWSIIWETERYDIRDGDLPQAEYNRGGQTKENWNLDINSGKSLRYATIHRAAHRYFYGNTGGLHRPAASGSILAQSKLKISYYSYGGTSNFYSGEVIAGTLISHVRIFSYFVGHPVKDTREIFSSTCHELGHAVHYNNMGNIQYWQVEDYIHESWACFVNWHLTMLEYRALNAPQSKLDYFYKLLRRQWWPYENIESKAIDDDLDYTSIFIDLVDDFDQSVNNSMDNTYPFDAVSGYTASKLNDMLYSSYGWSSLKTNLIFNLPTTGASRALIEHLFRRYESICK